MEREKKLIEDIISIRLWQGLFVVFILFILSIIYLEQKSQKNTLTIASRPTPPRIKLENGAIELFDPVLKSVEAPSLSPDGSQITYMEHGEENQLFEYEVDSIWVAKRNHQKQWTPIKLVAGNQPLIGHTETFFNPTFDNRGKYIIMGYAGFTNILGLPILPTIQTGIDLLENGKQNLWLTPKILNIGKEIIQHPRLSPDGQWLAFYTRKQKITRGIYLYNVISKKTFHISNHDDKHPTWSPDGTKLLFHYQKGGDALDSQPSNQPEQAYLGYFDFTCLEKNEVKCRRVLLDTSNETYTYFKHPTQLVGTNLLFFHGKLNAKGRHVLMVRRLEINGPIYCLQIEINGHKLTEIKHPASSNTKPVLVFLGKTGSHQTYHVYQLTNEALQTIEQVVQ